MGSQQGESDVKFQVHRRYYEIAPGIADILILENVPEYEMEKVVARELGAAWGCVTATVDPRLFGLSTSRARVYGLCWNKKMYKLDPSFSLMSILESLKAMPMMSAQSFFYQKLGTSTLTQSAVAR